jgi:hypothetical protein
VTGSMGSPAATFGGVLSLDLIKIMDWLNDIVRHASRTVGHQTECAH